jgi:hypothetical protein
MGLFTIHSDDLVTQLFRAPRGPGDRGWTNHVGCYLFEYVSKMVLSLIRDEFLLLNEETRQNLSVNCLGLAPFTHEELVHVIGTHYSDFVTGGQSDLQPIVYLTNTYRLNGIAGSYSYFRYGGPSQPQVPNPQALAQQDNTNLMKQVDKFIPDKFWVNVAKANFPLDNAPTLSLNVRYMIIGFLLDKICSNKLESHPTVEVCKQLLDYKITKSYTLRDLCRRHGRYDGDKKAKELITNARKNCFFTRQNGFPPYLTVPDEKKRSQLQAQWKFVTEICVEGSTGDGVTEYQRAEFKTVFSSHQVNAMLALPSICITDEYILFLLAIQDEYDARRNQLYLTRAEGQQKGTLPNLLEEWHDQGLPLRVVRALQGL